MSQGGSSLKLILAHRTPAWYCEDIKDTVRAEGANRTNGEKDDAEMRGVERWKKMIEERRD